MCCLRVSANVSYQATEADVELFTGIRVPGKTQQRLVHRHTFELPKAEQPIAELSADGGKIRIRTPMGEECRWLDYKGVRLHEFATAACFQDNQQLIDWVHQQPLSSPLTCLGDGHDGVWNLIEPMASEGQRREIQGLVSPDRESREGRWLNAAIESSQNPPLERQRRCHDNLV